MLRYLLFLVLTIVIGLVCYDLGHRAAHAYERMLVQRVANGLGVLGIGWARIEADGLRLELHGHAPDMFARELAEESAQATAPVATIVNFATATLAPPEHRDPVRVELHRDQRGITMTGQTASRTMRDQLNAALRRDGPDLKVHDLTGIQAAVPPAGWGPEITVSSLAASRLPNAYVVMEPGQVTVDGEVTSEDHRTKLTGELLERGGGRIAILLHLGLPPEVIVPFAFSAYKDAGGGIRLERCAARDVDEQALISGWLSRAGVEAAGQPCPVGLGGPRGNWPAAIKAGLDALAVLPAGRIDVEYRTANLTAFPPTSPRDFAAVELAFMSDMPDGFEGQGVVRADDIATLVGIGREQYWMRINRGSDGVTLAGKVPNEIAETTIVTHAAALYGGGQVHSGLIETTDAPPAGWQSAALRVLDHLSAVDEGAAELAGYRLAFSANVTEPTLAKQLHDGLNATLPDYEVSTSIRIGMPEQLAAIPLPGPRCAATLGRIIHDTPIEFDTGSAVITKASGSVLDDLAKAFRRCTGDPIEISGHTDSQGSEELNARISEARAKAVVTALVTRGIPLGWMVARGYGETQPIADNATEDGRARNRRIEFDPAEPATARADEED